MDRVGSGRKQRRVLKGARVLVMGTDPVPNKVALNSSLNFFCFRFLTSKMELVNVIASIRCILILLVEPVQSSFFFFIILLLRGFGRGISCPHFSSFKIKCGVKW